MIQSKALEMQKSAVRVNRSNSNVHNLGGRGTSLKLHFDEGRRVSAAAMISSFDTQQDKPMSNLCKILTKNNYSEAGDTTVLASTPSPFTPPVPLREMRHRKVASSTSIATTGLGSSLPNLDVNNVTPKVTPSPITPPVNGGGGGTGGLLVGVVKPELVCPRRESKSKIKIISDHKLMTPFGDHASLKKRQLSGTTNVTGVTSVTKTGLTKGVTKKVSTPVISMKKNKAVVADPQNVNLSKYLWINWTIEKIIFGVLISYLIYQIKEIKPAPVAEEPWWKWLVEKILDKLGPKDLFVFGVMFLLARVGIRGLDVFSRKLEISNNLLQEERRSEMNVRLRQMRLNTRHEIWKTVTDGFTKIVTTVVRAVAPFGIAEEVVSTVLDIARGRARDKSAAAAAAKKENDANFEVDNFATTSSTTSKKFSYDGNGHRRVVQTSSSPFSVGVPTHPRVNLGLGGPAPNNRGCGGTDGKRGLTTSRTSGKNKNDKIRACVLED
ncbi:uncharacterized protein LOC118433069 [Folsomia candida]|uniref:Uncharacterized protein n=1 Tax=Folsomia candida TaxID=158441 RepID=A0A226D334_FOLCA|nr:uncharacterized protein LOC118433069 [Folsomia candida]XP_035700537.1 uncharacterized protein LOC118433069 [Folsomia candida]XP_035700538.1 uncharacterized protein LOC118433069 [Folsomia candida]XP_035700539.1 uncharacterized protein LOC118433069 [Folsomia candida]OXA39238.1 hypothetical protein Fcan01_25985 [Folsomia candida]